MLRPRLVVAIAALGIAGALAWFWIVPARRRGREAPRQPPPPADVFKADVRPTPPRAPEEERSGFQLPPGFEIELFASEPDIGKPLNMAFDSRGRLWITQSREYPHAAAEGKGRDKVLILEDTDGDGRADKFIPFAEGLNIPVGVVPVRGGAVVYSIPYIYRFFDLDGDGRADDRAVLYGRFAYDDTHGMVSHFRRGFDGWIYACHGFTNKSTVSGRDGNTVVMDSGNTFRFRLDGSRIEHFTHGQVNPFGLAFDPLGNLYSADCHSQPIYQLLEDAAYPHFARPATGIGFGPAMMDHDHGSTAIAGIAYYAAEQFPEEYRGNIFTGNVVTSRINRDSLDARGSTPVAVAEPDFVVSQDPWFRPVDLQLAPDGSLYVADFYNRIIGHVEVPLDHPGRDKLRGRIWRIRYRGPGAGGRSSGRVRLAGARIEELLAALGDPNLKVRMLAADELVDRVGRPAVEPVRRLVETRAAKPTQKSHGLWVLARLRALEPSLLAAAAADPDPTVRVHAFRILAQEAWTGSERALALTGLSDLDPRVERAAAEAARLHPDASQVRPLVDLRARIPPADTHLFHATRLALRDQLRSPGVLESAARERWPERDARALSDAAVGVDSAQAALFLLGQIEGSGAERSSLPRSVTHAARFLPGERLDDLVRAAQSIAPDDAGLQAELWRSFEQGITERALALPARARAWGESLIPRLLAGAGEEHWRRAFALAGSLRWRGAEARLVKAFSSPELSVATRAAAADALVAIDPRRYVPLVGAALRGGGEPFELQTRALAALRRVETPAATAELVAALGVAPARLQIRLAASLVQREDSARAFLDAVEQGKASRHLLLRTGIQGRLKTLPQDLRERAAKLADGLAPEEESLEGLIERRRAAYSASSGRAEAGAQVFEKYCARCHQIGGRGKTVGPQLDGIGNRGLDRLIEDVLDPNRNVESAFRSSMIKLKSGGSVTGIVVKDEAAALVVVDEQGEEARIPKQDVASRVESRLSPMPSDFAEQIPADEFNHLLAFLVTAGSKGRP